MFIKLDHYVLVVQDVKWASSMYWFLEICIRYWGH